MAKLTEGSPAPDFTLMSGEGETYSLSEMKGKRIVLYFYPKDETPGCTKEACSFRDMKGEFEQAGAVILGVSPDDQASHERFKAKHSLTFPLLSDPEAKVAQDYGVWVEKNNYGKKYMGIERTTFAIDENGKISKIWPKVKVDGHVDEVLEYVASQRSGAGD